MSLTCFCYYNLFKLHNRFYYQPIIINTNTYINIRINFFIKKYYFQANYSLLLGIFEDSDNNIFIKSVSHFIDNSKYLTCTFIHRQTVLNYSEALI